MNEELQKQIAAILKQALEAAQHGGQWLAGQIPDVLRQLLVWNITVGALCALGLLVLLILDVVAWRKAAAYEGAADIYRSGNGYFTAAMMTGIACLPGTFLLMGASDGLKAFVAPKLFLLEYAANLVK